MKNTLKFLGIIALAAIIGISFTGCDTGNGGGGGGGGGSGNMNSVDSALIGTWVGDARNGTLEITANNIRAMSPGGAASVAGVVDGMRLEAQQYGMSVNITASGGKFTASITGLGSEDLLVYSIVDGNLTIDEPGYYRDEPLFVGTRQ